jgi:prepilin-type processing-associated H-X9-DG protein
LIEIAAIARAALAANQDNNLNDANVTFCDGGAKMSAM